MTGTGGPRPAGTDAAAVGAAVARNRLQKGEREVRVVSHSNMLYWWVVWVWGYLCALLTEVRHISAAFGDKQLKFFPDAWLGLSFIGLVMLVVLFTNVRTRVLQTVIIATILTLIAVVLEWRWGLSSVFSWMPELRVQLNLAFYVVFSTILMVLWFIVVFGIDNSTVWRFTSGQVAQSQRLGQSAANVYDTRGMLMRRLPSDVFRHKILGLGFLGLGTGDLVFKPAAVGSESFVLENVWRVNQKQQELERFLARAPDA